ncbi:F-box protein CPR1-like [Silene latifolia]|uniref:F-box protein CPR1-like n=1 Tax=Silene latifolia TaxID=37657 RepID=UPI003D7771C9
MATQTLPPDIISEIISRLPVKPLLRFKCVAKSWNSLINSPKFIKHHLNQQTLISDQFPQIIINSHKSLSVTSIDDQNPKILRFSELNHPLNNLPDHNAVEIDGTCNGVVCISPYDKKSLSLYNPSTKTHRLLPPFAPSTKVKPYFHKIDPNNFNLVVFGFGYDSDNDDYIVLRMIQNNEHRESSVYSLKNNSWNFVDDHTSIDYRIQILKGVLVNETLHFCAVKIMGNYKLKRIIKCFNVKTRTFSLMEIPNIVEKFDKFDFIMSELGGCLCLLVNHVNFDADADLCRKLMCSDMWVKKEEGWVRMFSVNDPECIGASMQIKPVVYSKDGERVLLQLDGMVLVWYDLGSREFEKVTIHGLPLKDGKNGGVDAWTFVESLVCVGSVEEKPRDNSVPKQKKNNNDSSNFLSKGFKLRL